MKPQPQSICSQLCVSVFGHTCVCVAHTAVLVPKHVAFPSGTRVLRTDSDANKVILGIPREPLDFLTEACKLVHPVERSGVINLAVAVAIQKHRELSPLELLKCRKSFFSRSLSIIRSLSEQEASLHANMPPHLGKVMK